VGCIVSSMNEFIYYWIFRIAGTPQLQAVRIFSNPAYIIAALFHDGFICCACGSFSPGNGTFAKVVILRPVFVDIPIRDRFLTDEERFTLFRRRDVYLTP
jgi:hypothetical protein